MEISIKCNSLKAKYSVKNGLLRYVVPYKFIMSETPMIQVSIEEVGNRIITFSCEDEIEHIKINQRTPMLDGKESTLYAIKMSYLYRLVILEKLKINDSLYEDILIKRRLYR